MAVDTLHCLQQSLGTVDSLPNSHPPWTGDPIVAAQQGAPRSTGGSGHEARQCGSPWELRQERPQEDRGRVGGEPRGTVGRRGQRCTHRAKGCAGGLHHGTPRTSLSCQLHQPGGSTSCSTSVGWRGLAHPCTDSSGPCHQHQGKNRAWRWHGCQLGPATSSSGGTGCGGRDGVPWGWEQSHRELGARAAAQGQEQKGGSGAGQEDVSSCVMRAPRRVQLVRHASCPAQMSCRQRGRGSGRLGSPAQGSAAEATSSRRALLLGSTTEEPPLSSPVLAAVPWGCRAVAAERGPEGTVPAKERLHSHCRLLPKGSGTGAQLTEALGCPASHVAPPAWPHGLCKHPQPLAPCWSTLQWVQRCGEASGTCCRQQLRLWLPQPPREQFPSPPCHMTPPRRRPLALLTTPPKSMPTPTNPPCAAPGWGS